LELRNSVAKNVASMLTTLQQLNETNFAAISKKLFYKQNTKMKTKAAIFCISKILFLSMVFFKETSSDKTFLLHISKANNS